MLLRAVWRLVVLAAAPLASGALFDEHGTLDLVLDGPVDETVLRKNDATYRPFTLTVGERALPVEVRTRGKSRLEFCDFPPLRIRFDRDAAAGTIFEGQKALKLVTQCDGSAAYRINLLEEYLAYRIFNRVTDASFRVRLARISYRDDGRERDVSPGFLIEDVDAVAARLGGEQDLRNRIARTDLDPVHATEVAIFQLLIGNTDFALIAGLPGEECCHNGKLIRTPDRLVTIPYDFDVSGLVNPPYALPAEAARIKTVRQRRYWGFCTDEQTLERALEPFRALEPELEALVHGIPGLEGNSGAPALRYLNAFYKGLAKRGLKTFRRCR